MATSLIVPLAYITVLVTSLAIFSRVYRRRKAAEKTSWEAWFPTHPARDTYISLISSPDSVPDSLLKSALLVRATADVKRIWRIRDDKMALTVLQNKGLVGDDTMARFAAAEKELEAEIVDVVSEANTFRPGWGGMIFQTATEMAHAERTREIVLNIPKAKAREEKIMLKRRKVLGEPVPRMVNIPTNPSPSTPSKPSSTSTADSEPAQPAQPATIAEPTPSDPDPSADAPAAPAAPATAPSTSDTADSNSGTSTPSRSGANTPSKNTPSGKKKKKKGGK